MYKQFCSSLVDQSMCVCGGRRHAPHLCAPSWLSHGDASDGSCVEHTVTHLHRERAGQGRVVMKSAVITPHPPTHTPTPTHLEAVGCGVLQCGGTPKELQFQLIHGS